MSTNPQADAWMESYIVPWGVGDGKESLRDSVVSTNAASHQALPLISDLYPKIDELFPLIRAVAADAAKAVLHGERWKWENQPPGGEGTNDLVESVNATNGQVFRTATDLGKVRAQVAENNLLLRAIAGALKLDVGAILNPPVTPAKPAAGGQA